MQVAIVVDTRPDTYFAPPERASDADIRAAAALATEHPVMSGVLTAVGGVVALLNDQRQIVAMNSELLRRLGASDPSAVLGLRPGEALGCTAVEAAPNGCGTGRPCATCGAAIAIVSSANTSETIERECLLTVRRDHRPEPLEFVARARRIVLDGSPFTLVLLHDIQDRKRREALERCFFHDLINTVGSLKAYAELLADTKAADSAELVSEVRELADRALREIEAQRNLALAEQGDFTISLQRVAADSLWQGVEHALHASAAAGGVTLVTVPGVDSLETDPTLLTRVLTNMVKNALEATPPGGVVRCWCTREPETITFRCHNVGALDERVALRVFQRSFTTKPGAGRGLGTYGMKLFVERYLGGTVGFSSTAAAGTEFFVRLPHAG